VAFFYVYHIYHISNNHVTQPSRRFARQDVTAQGEPNVDWAGLSGGTTTNNYLSVCLYVCTHIAVLSF
jgi:hypothetical protein